MTPMAIKIFGIFCSIINPPTLTIVIPVTVEIIPAIKIGCDEYKYWKKQLPINITVRLENKSRLLGVGTR